MIELKYLLTHIYHQNFLSRTNIIQSEATNVIKIRVYIPQESTQRKKANCLKKKCILCEEKHKIYKCQRYKAMNDLEKFNTIKANKLCYN